MGDFEEFKDFICAQDAKNIKYSNTTLGIAYKALWKRGWLGAYIIIAKLNGFRFISKQI